MGDISYIPWSAGEDVAVAWAKASRSRRTEEDCLRAELNREFYKRSGLEKWQLCEAEEEEEEEDMYRPLRRMLAAFLISMWPASNDYMKCMIHTRTLYYIIHVMYCTE